MATVFPNAYYVTTVTNLSTTNATTCYTVPTIRKGAYVTQIWASDTGGTPRTLTVVARISGTDYTLVYQGSVDNALPPFELQFFPLQLAPADSIKCTASNGSVHVFVMAAEIGEAT